MLTIDEIQVLLPVIDAGIKGAGIQIFQNDGGVKLQAILAKLQAMAQQQGADKEGSNGK